jgi:tRNA U55 pseudouridine synthase TruB
MELKKVTGIFNWRIKPLKLGIKVNAFTVLSLLKLKDKDGSLLYKVRCKCGIIKKLSRSKLNRTQSCGCMVIDRMRIASGEVSHNVLYTTYRHRAKKTGISFKLSRPQFRDLISKNCFYCNTPPKDYNTYVTDGNKSKAIRQESIDRAWIKANGIDRVDSNKGYILSNCVPCCEPCNRSKLDYSIDEFLSKIKQIYEFKKLGR